MVNASATKAKQKGSELDRSSLEENVEELYNSDEEGGTTVDGIYIPPPVKPVCSFDPHGPRLIITKIENSFFKSYAENEILGPFTKCFNAIVGPNGSGKSNVIDSILFVFGYRAAKIRCKKVSVLLHNSEKYRNVQSCTVSVHFALITDKEGKEYEIIPGSEFVVSRTAFKDNSSYYTLNNKRVQFKDVAVVLKKYGIDLDYNRFLILQGEVEQIAMMKCKAENEHETGMLEYLEDIIGTTRYKKPIDALNERVEQLAEVRNARLNRARLAENELEALKEPMEQAVEFLQKENTVIRCKNFLYQKEICELEEASSKVEEERKTVSDAQKELLEKLAELAEKKEAKDKILKEESQKFDKITKERDALKEAFNKANTKDVELKENMMQTNATRKKTKDLLKEEKEKLIKLQKVPAESEKSVEECKRKEESLLKQKEKLDEEKAVLVDNIRKETQPLQDEKEALQTKLVDLKKAVDETKSAFTLAESEYNLYVKNEETERAKYENLKDVFENNKKTIQERTEALKDLEKKIPTTSKALHDAQRELEQVRGEEANLSQEFRGKSNYLQEIRSAMQASRSSNRVLESLMHQKRNGKCDGLFGRLGDLGAIDKKFDVAVSTACGPLDNIVVDNVDTAKWCINFLKQNNIGVATFIALDKQEHLRQYAESSIKTPENVHRLYDLIRVQDERVRTAFYYALRDTLVANDLEQATRIAYGAKRYRVVTLNGELIETTGTMSGGGRSVRRGRMGQSVAAVTNTDPREIQQMEGEVQRMEKRIRELRQRQQELEEQINVMMPQLRQMKIDQEKFTMELNALRQQQPQLEVQVKQQLAKSKATQADPKAAGKLKAVAEERKQAFEKASSTAGKLQEKVDKLTKELNEKSIMRIKAMDKNIKTVVASIEKVRAEITRLKVAVTTAERNAKKSEEKIAAMEQDIVDMEEKMRAMRQEREEIEEDGKKLIACIEQHENTLKEGENKFGDLKQEVKVLTEKEKKLKTENVDVTEKLKTLDKQIHVHKAQMQQWRHKIKGLELQEVPDATVEPLKTYTKEEIEETDVDGIVKQLKAAEDLIKLAKPNLNAIQEYRKKQKVFIERTRELEEVTEKRNEMRALFDKLRDQRKLEFTEGYNIIRMKLKEMYQMITLEGDADFELVDSFDPFTEGIQFNVRPPKKSWKNISNLSGGEKTLSSLALVFAVHYYKPSPLYIMDEIDAALDFKNVSIIGNYIKERTKNAQFIIISLRSNMFELCDNLIGIYKTYNCTHSLTIDPCGFEEELRNPHEINNMRAEKAINADEDKENHVGNDAEMETNEETMANQSLIDHDYISPNTSMNLSNINGKASDLPSEVEDSFVENMDVDP